MRGFHSCWTLIQKHRALLLLLSYYYMFCLSLIGKRKFHRDEKNGLAPYFIFGDFNFRCDTEGVIKKLTGDLTKHRIQNARPENVKIQFRNSEGRNVLTIGKKEFLHVDHQIKFKGSWLQQFDRELEPLREVLVEYPITFPPSYPYEENPDMPRNYMFTRCPAWCDRIVMSPTARNLIVDDTFSATDYNTLGENTCMGDHKPIFLSVRIKTLQGTVSSCCFKHGYEFSDFELEPASKIKFDAKPTYCLYSNYDFCRILFECRKLDSVFDTSVKLEPCFESNKNNDVITKGRNSSEQSSRNPLVSINVTDSDNLNICVCALYSKIEDKNSNKNNEDEIEGSICPRCQNIIKTQPIDQMCTLVSKRLMLGNIIVNRIDTHYLAAFIDNHQEPYTPESAESHSPCPEFESDSQNYLNNENDRMHRENSAQLFSSSVNATLNVPGGVDSPDCSNVQDLRGIVSPCQLKSRLEHLQRTSLKSDIDEVDYNQLKLKRSSTCCRLA